MPRSVGAALTGETAKDPYATSKSCRPVRIFILAQGRVRAGTVQWVCRGVSRCGRSGSDRCFRARPGVWRRVPGSNLQRGRRQGFGQALRRGASVTERAELFIDEEWASGRSCVVRASSATRSYCSTLLRAGPPVQRRAAPATPGYGSSESPAARAQRCRAWHVCPECRCPPAGRPGRGVAALRRSSRQP